MTLIGDSVDGGEDDELDQPLVNLKDKLRELTETHHLVSICDRAWENRSYLHKIHMFI